MLREILPDYIIKSIKNIKFEYINELRLRVNKPIVINIFGINYFLNNNGKTTDLNGCLICSEYDIKYILNNISNNSLYSINDQIINGYITIGGGIRVGISGDVVSNNGIIKTIKNISSLNIRIPHEVLNCSCNAIPFILNGNIIYSTLVISVPGCGKTTFLRDLAYQFGNRELQKNILIVDERNEICGVGEHKLKTGYFTDVYNNCSKEYAFTNGIRSMKPDVIISDEIDLNKDVSAISNAITSGVSVICSIHANGINELKQKDKFKDILNNKFFKRYVVLDNSKGVGTISKIYNENLEIIYLC